MVCHILLQNTVSEINPKYSKILQNKTFRKEHLQLGCTRYPSDDMTIKIYDRFIEVYRQYYFHTLFLVFNTSRFSIFVFLKNFLTNLVRTKSIYLKCFKLKHFLELIYEILFCGRD